MYCLVGLSVELIIFNISDKCNGLDTTSLMVTFIDDYRLGNVTNTRGQC